MDDARLPSREGYYWARYTDDDGEDWWAPALVLDPTGDGMQLCTGERMPAEWGPRIPYPHEAEAVAERELRRLRSDGVPVQDALERARAAGAGLSSDEQRDDPICANCQHCHVPKVKNPQAREWRCVAKPDEITFRTAGHLIDGCVENALTTTERVTLTARPCVEQPNRREGR